MYQHQLQMILSGLLVALLTIPATAQSDSSYDYDYDFDQSSEQNWRQEDRQDDRERMRRDRDRSDQEDWELGDRSKRRDERVRDRRERDRWLQDDRERESDRQSERSETGRWSENERDRGRDSQSYRMHPIGWHYIAYDLDNDGYYDGGEWIYYYDLQQARQRSQQRSRNEGQQRGQRREVRVQGEVVSMETKKMTGKDQQSDRQHQFAELEKESGRTVCVCLGTKNKINQLDIQKGDQITVEGIQTRVDGEKVVMAQKVSAGNDSITNQLPQRQQLHRFSGEVRNLRETRKGGRDQRHTIAKIKFDNGQVEQVDLGPENELQDLELQEGDDITLLAKEGRIAGDQMLLAQLIRANGNSVDVREATNRSLQMDRQEARGRNADRWDRSESSD